MGGQRLHLPLGVLSLPPPHNFPSHYLGSGSSGPCTYGGCPWLQTLGGGSRAVTTIVDFSHGTHVGTQVFTSSTNWEEGAEGPTFLTIISIQRKGGGQEANENKSK